MTPPFNPQDSLMAKTFSLDAPSNDFSRDFRFTEPTTSNNQNSRPIQKMEFYNELPNVRIPSIINSLPRQPSYPPMFPNLGKTVSSDQEPKKSNPDEMGVEEMKGELMKRKSSDFGTPGMIGMTGQN